MYPLDGVTKSVFTISPQPHPPHGVRAPRVVRPGPGSWCLLLTRQPFADYGISFKISDAIDAAEDAMSKSQDGDVPLTRWRDLKNKKLRRLYQAQAMQEHSRAIHEELEAVIVRNFCFVDSLTRGTRVQCTWSRMRNLPCNLCAINTHSETGEEKRVQDRKQACLRCR